MGAEFSRTVVENPRSLSTIQFGVQYTAVDTSVWPHLIPLAQWFTPEDARAIHRRLRARTTPSLLSFREFVALLSSSGDASSVWPRHQPEEDDESALRTRCPPQKRKDNRDPATKVPVSLSVNAEPQPLVMELCMQHIFHTFKTSGARTERIYGLEFLATMVVVSRAIWRLEDKVGLLAELFLDPASSATTGTAAPAVKLKQTDVALVIMCAMRGVAKATVGTALVWGNRCVDIVAVAKKLAADCFQHVIAGRQASVDATAAADPLRTAATITQHEFVSYVRQKPVIRNFLARFSAEELRNPTTFASSKLPETGFAVDESYRSVLASQAKLYATLVQQHVSLEGRLEKRQTSAALLIQSTWRRRCSKLVLQQEIQAQEDQRNASASVLQSFAKNRHACKQLRLAADVERDVFNGGVLVAGSGPCLGVAARDGRANSREARRQALSLIEAFKTSRIALIDMSPTFALAIGQDGQSLYAWGRCLPREYADDCDDNGSHTCLFSTVPRQLAFRFTQGRVASLVCGLRHALALMDDGMVFSWGFNDHGQLGHGPPGVLAARSGRGDSYRLYYDEFTGREQEYLATPTMLVYFQGSEEQLADPIPIAQVACGDYYCVALSCDGDVFTWGEASEGQLGHGDVHPAFQVGLVDRYMTNSAYTFLSEPEPVLSLSDTRVVQVACQRNHVMALSDDSRVYEWGNWGKRRGTDTEHAFAPVERSDTQELRLCRIAVGDHHALAEGASAWISVVIPDEHSDGPECHHTRPLHEAECYVEILPGFSLDRIEQHLIVPDGFNAWKCQFADIDVDDVEGSDCDSAGSPDSSSSQSIWHRRVEKMALNTVQDVARFDPKIRALVQLGAFFRGMDPPNQPHAPGEGYASVVQSCLGDQVQGRLVVYPRGKPAGHYIQFLLSSLPTESSGVVAGSEFRSEEMESRTSLAPHQATIEFFVRGSSTARGTVTSRGFATHVYHPSMAEEARRLKQQQLRQKRRPVAQLTETNGLFVLEVNEQLLGSWSDAGDHDGALEEAAEMDAEMIGHEITRRVLELQESGVLAVLVVLDLFDADAFELDFGTETGIYIPVLMLDVKTRGHFVESDQLLSGEGRSQQEEQPWWSIYDVLAQLETAQRPRSVAGSRPHSAVELPPPLLARCFLREDTALARVDAAFALGAAGVLFVRNPRDATRDADALASIDPLFWSSPTLSAVHDQRFIGLLPYEHGMLLRSVSCVEPEDGEAPSSSSPQLTPNNLRSVVDVQFEIRTGGTSYAWGVAQNGRLGLGFDLGSGAAGGGELFLDGYEALTDSAYRYVAAPTRIPALDGISMKQLVCGSAHSLALTADGEVFSWGRGSRGELALSGTAEGFVDQWAPQLVRGLQYETITQVAANDQCSLFLTEVQPQEQYMERRRQIAQMKAAAKRKSSLLREEGGHNV